MKKPTAVVSLLMAAFICSTAFAQMTLKPDSPLYNVPYDSLVGLGHKGIATAKILGGNTPKLYIMFVTRAIEINPDAPDAYGVRGQLWMLLDEVDNADKDFNKALDLTPDYPVAVKGLYELIVQKANKYAIKDVPKQMAMEVFKRSQAFVKIAPDSMAEDRQQALTKGAIYKLQAESPDAIQKYVDAINSDSTESIAAFEAAVPLIEKTDNKVMLAIVEQGVGKKYYLMKQYAKAKAAFQKAIATRMCDGSSYVYAALMLDEQENKPADAEKLCLEGLKILKDDSEILSYLGDLALKRGKAAIEKKDYAGGIKELEKYQLYKPMEPRGAQYLAIGYFNTKNYAKAGQQLKRSKLVSDSVEFSFLFPNAEEVIAYGDKPGKKAPVLQTLLLENEKNEGLFDKGNGQISDGKFDEAIQTIQQALSFFEKNNYAVGKSICYNGIGTAYHHKKEYGKAKEYYSKAIASGARSSSPYSNLAVIQLYGDKDEAAGEKTLQQGLQQFPNAGVLKEKLGDFYDAKAVDLYEAKNYSAASTFYEKEVQVNEKAETYVFLGFCYYKMNSNDKCRTAFKTGMDLDEKLAEKYTAINQILDQIGR